MPDGTTLLLFTGASLTLFLIPGPAVAYIVTMSLHQGRWTGIFSSLGIGLGSATQYVVATLGLATVLLSSPWLYHGMKLVGAGYLVYLGGRILMKAEEASSVQRSDRARTRRAAQRSYLVGVLNPKTAVFFLAFMPQFVDPAGAGFFVQMVILGILFHVLGFLTGVAYSILAGALGETMAGRPWVAATQRYVLGGVLMAVGLVGAL